jgi:hypothetical protein
MGEFGLDPQIHGAAGFSRKAHFRLPDPRPGERGLRAPAGRALRRRHVPRTGGARRALSAIGDATLTNLPTAARPETALQKP